MTNHTDYAASPAPVYSLTVHGRSKRFPVNRIFCVGRNYAAHAREMGKDPDRDPPFFFMKPASAIVDAAAPVSVAYPSGAVHPVAETCHLDSESTELKVNGSTKQASDVAKLIWSTAECIAHLSLYEPLRPGDLIMTGTPEGVGPVVAGDAMRGRIEGLSEVAVTVIQQTMEATQ
ncbi:fumarylacetoacetate hydrolase family protein [Trinickia mobilis]|uniref:fumarylacetoacetate hydrolase family protein n=1 Tax=Trinickia mobilis TaxID=2816356 RepID=UPI001A8DD534|nr:fumarylacetoacetate hydrolase family protein [Trinickia mobilis]